MSLPSILRRLRHRGARELLSLVVKNARHMARGLTPAERARRDADRAFDLRYGTDTHAAVGLGELDIRRSRASHCRRYEMSNEAMLRDPVAALAIDPTQWSFVDYGAGKGRMVMLAMEMGFRDVTGVELSHRLCGIARANIARFRAAHPSLPAPQLQCADATVLRPQGQRLLAYFYNPFDASIMAVVRRRLEAAIPAGAEAVSVIYANPEFAEVFAEAPGWSWRELRPGLGIATADPAAFAARGLAAAA